MRIKLVFESSPRTSNQRKVCFYIEQGSCKNISDLAYLIQKRFYQDSGQGVVSLYLSNEFYFPPQESINVVEENDVLAVKFAPKEDTKTTRGVKSQHQPTKKRKILKESSSLTSSSSSTETSSSEKDDVITKHVKLTKKESNIVQKRILINKGNKNISHASQKQNTKTATSRLQSDVKNKSSIPISRLGVVTSTKTSSSSGSSSSSSGDDDSSSSENENTAKKLKTTKKANDNSSSSDSSSSTSSETETTEKQGRDNSCKERFPNNPNQGHLKKSNPLTSKTTKKNSTNETSDFQKPKPISKSYSKISITKTVRPKNSTNTQQQKRKASSSSSSSNSSSSDSEDKIADKSQKSGLKSKIDFHVSNLSNNATSTPSSSFSTKDKLQQDVGNKEDKSNKKKNISWEIAAKDVYKNVSEVLTNFPAASKPINNATTTNGQSTSKYHQDTTLNISQTSGTLSSAGTSTIDSQSTINEENKVRGKTLRNRRRRQKKIEAQRARREQERQQLDENKNNVFSAIKAVEHLNTPNSGVAESEKNQTDPNGKENGKCVVNESPHIVSDAKDYSTYSMLSAVPELSSCIAFKILELDSTYQPQVSDYKEAILKSHNTDDGTVELELCEGFRNKNRENGKFDIPADDDNVEDAVNWKSTNTICKSWKELLEPRLIVL